MFTTNEHWICLHLCPAASIVYQVNTYTSYF